MNLEDVKKVMQKVCPDMLSSDNFMEHMMVKYCNGDFVDLKPLTDEERDAWNKLREVIGTATVGQVIKYLKENFKPTDKLCYMDCVEGLRNDCTYVTTDQLGKRFFYCVKDLRTRIDDVEADQMFLYVKDDDIVIC